MDNITHSLVGWTLGQTGLKRKTRKGLAALILGANAPDIDVFLGWVPWAPLATHRGVTHSLVGGMLVLPAMLAALLWFYDRWQAKRGAEFKSGLPMHFGWLLALSYLGCLTHPLLDWQTSYAIQLFSPFSNRWYHNDSLFIVDPWIWLGLGFAILLSRRRERGAEGKDWRGPPRMALAILALYVTLNGMLTAWVRDAARSFEPYADPDAMVASPPPLAFWRRELIWRTGHTIYRGRYDLLRSPFGLPEHDEGEPDGMTDPLALRALMTPQMAPFRRWSILPMARVQRERCRAIVQFQDARFGRPGAGALGETVALPTGAPGC